MLASFALSVRVEHEPRRAVNLRGPAEGVRLALRSMFTHARYASRGGDRTMGVRYRPLGVERLSDVACCPGGAEVKGKKLRGNITETAAWRRRMIELGMRGVVAYDEDGPRGFAEYMPAEVAPVPIDAPGAAVLMCYHWSGTSAEDPEHLAMERELIGRVIEETRPRFTGLVTQGWDVPTHFPIPFLEELGFRETVRHAPIALMWLPYRTDARDPALAPAAYAPRDLSDERLLAIDAAFSARCPYSIDTEAYLKETVSAHPLKERIRMDLRRIDTREDAFASAVAPFDWAWVFFNGEAIGLFEYPGGKLAGEITRRIETMKQ
jgi:hypothetical protein